MADFTLSRDQSVPATTRTKYTDLGDDTYAQVVSTVPSGDTPASSVIAPTHTAVNVNGSTLALAANDSREYALLVNDSDTVIYLRLGAAAVVNTGIRVNASGGSYEMSAAGGNLYRGAIYANHGGGAVNKVLLVTEGV